MDRPATYSEAFAEYAANCGAEKAELAWILTPWDTWERNPHYAGPPVPHPESDDCMGWTPEELEAFNAAEMRSPMFPKVRKTDDECPF